MATVFEPFFVYLIDVADFIEQDGVRANFIWSIFTCTSFELTLYLVYLFISKSTTIEV